ncbi:hypothetical protein VW29_10845 [Devosia limi DSM 17137]|uniref:ATP:glycerol 3-phosphotransferase n=1 Tax=Devosia limi DSM 17137 TaxID=1121477 RepID=A0A0F5LRZ1_9HYPH|nr:FGGY-family carbohydrate kinase [Devosia limi]KKB84437.1 hypothetical protein VW29_10845 [Devosia limi DSM 17137]SHF59931.1 glycerol kinase [Devosia limi DSM 17137]
MRQPSRPILVLDLGTTSLRCSIVSATGAVLAMRRTHLPQLRDDLGLAWDGDLLAARVLEEVRLLAAEWQPQGIAIANQRATALIWDAHGSAVQGPVLSWSDGRTREQDRRLRALSADFIPGLSASKWRWLLDRCDADRSRSRAGLLRAGTLDSWLVWVLSEGQSHVTDHVNASHTGLFDTAVLDWNYPLATALGLEPSLLAVPVPCTQIGANATAIADHLPILAVIGDQQASLVGQGCDTTGSAKITFGTSAVLNVILGEQPLAQHSRSAFGNVALSSDAGVLYGAEAAVMSAGSSIEWMIRLGIIPTAEAIDGLVDPTQRSSATYVAALDGLGVPHWLPHARGAFFGLSAGSGAEEMVRAVLDGIAAGAADIVEQLESACGLPLTDISIDGGLAKSAAFTVILAATLGRPLRLSQVAEATTHGAARLAFRGLGHDMPARPDHDGGRLVAPDRTLPADRDAWGDAVDLVIEHHRRSKLRTTQRNA